MTVLAGELIQDRGLMRRLRRYSADVDWIQEHRGELRLRYNEMYVSVKNLKVVCAAPSMEELVRLLREAGEDPGDHAVDYISEIDTNLLL